VCEVNNDLSDDLPPAIPSVSWLMCAHIANDQLYEALLSCLNQTFTDFECILVANGPESDSIAEKVQYWFGNDARLQVYRTLVKHLNFSLSLGLHHARAPLVARMDSDDIAMPDRLERQVMFMNDNPSVTVLGCDYERIDSAGRSIDNITLPRENAAIRKALFRGNPLCHPSVVFRRDVVLRVGGYLGGLHAEDYDLWSRLALDQSVVFANFPHICQKYRMVGVGRARGSRLAYASMAASQFRNFVSGAGWSWVLAALISVVKAFTRSNSIHYNISDAD